MDATTHHPSPSPARRARWRRGAPLLLVIPFIGTLWVSTYASLRPALWGIPFFYWYQFLWIGIAATLTILVFGLERADGASRAGGGRERGRPHRPAR